MCGGVADFFNLHVDFTGFFGGAVNLFADNFQFVCRRFVSCLGGGNFMLLLAQAVVGFVNRV